MYRKAFVVLAAAAAMALGIFEAAQAQVMTPPGVLRAQANAIRGAVSKNLEMIIKPKLVIARGATGPVTTLTLSKDERFLASAAGDNSIRVWDLTVGKEVGRLTGHTAKIVSLAISPDSATAASASADGELRIWDMKRFAASQAVPKGASAIRFVFYTPKGEVLAIDDKGQAQIIETKGGKATGRFEASKGAPSAAAVSGDGKILAVSTGDDKITLVGLPAGNKIGELKDGPGGIAALAVSAAGGQIAAGGKRGEAAVFDLRSNQRLAKFKALDSNVSAIAVSESSKMVAAGGEDGSLRLSDVSTGKAVKDLPKHGAQVTYAAMDAEGSHLLTSSSDGSTRLSSTISGQTLVSLYSTVRGWSAVDPKGRFDGAEASLDGVEWQADQAKLPVQNFSEKYYEPVLVAKAMKDPKMLGEVRGIPDGIHLPPKVEIVPGGTPKDKVKVEVKAADQGGSGVSDVKLFRNGKLVEDKAKTDTKKTEGREGEQIVNRYDVDLAPGVNVLSAVAVNKESLESPPSVIEVQSGKAPQAPRMQILTVGINKYKNSELNLDYAQVDADSIDKFFSPTGRFPYQPGKSTHLINSQATKAAIVGQIKDLQKAPLQDAVFIYLAGHGVGYDDEWYFVPYDLEHPDQPASLKAGGLSSAELKREIEAITASRVFLVIDACQSGGAVSPIKRFEGMKALRMLARSLGVHILSATDRDQFAVELKDLGHGIFTYSLLKGMEGAADSKRTGTVTVKETMSYVEEQVPALAKRYANYLQYPSAHSRGFDFDVAYSK